MIKNKRTEILVLAVILLIQSLIYIYFGANKTYLHMDEAYSLGLSAYNKVEIQENVDFYNTWHNAEYYRDYLEVDEEERNDLSPVYVNQKNDVHPPFYYLLLRLFMGLSVGRFTMWGGVALNIIIHLFITVFTYLIIQKLLSGDTCVKEKALFLTMLSALTLSALTSVLYIRMYALATLNILVTVYLHLRLYENGERSLKYCIFIGVMALFGSLTHYFYLYFIFALFVLFAVLYVERHEYKNLRIYIMSLGFAACLSLLIFPHSLTHMFFGYRGQGVITNLINPTKYSNVFAFLGHINTSVFNFMLFGIMALLAAMHGYKHVKDNHTHVCGKVRSAYIIIGFPTLFYLIITSVSSPWVELRYVLPICVLIFVMVMCYLYRLLRTMTREMVSNGAIIMLSLIMLVTPIAVDATPEPLYDVRADAVEDIKENTDVPAFYFFNSKHDRFLDDILLFSMIDNSYIAYDIGADEEKILVAFESVDTSEGVTVFINELLNDDELLGAMKNALRLENAEFLYELNACRVYRLS